MLLVARPATPRVGPAEVDDRQLSLLAGQAQDAVDLFDPARLTQGRQAKGWTKRYLAEQVDVTATAIGQFEAGVHRPRPALLTRLAQALDVTPTFFAAGRPRAAVDAVNTHFRSLRSMRVYERDQAVTFAGQVWELAQALEQHVHLPKLDLPSVHADATDDTHVGATYVGHTPVAAHTAGRAGAPLDILAASGGRVAAAAQRVRQQWALGDRPVAHLVRLLEAHGVLVALLPFNDARRVDAFSTTATPRPVVVLTAEKNDVFRHRFTAAHELGHLLLHSDAAPGDPAHEREADAFAAELLLPRARLAQELPPRLDLPGLLALQQMWGVSVEALLYRGRELAVYSEATHRRGRIKVHDLRSRGLLPTGQLRDYPGEQPLLLRHAYNTAASHTDLTLHSLAAELAWAPALLSRLLGSVEDDRPHLRLV